MTAFSSNRANVQLASLAAEGDSFTFDAFTATDASNLGLLLYARLASEPRPALISITLANGVTVFQMATGPGVQPDNEVWVQRKRRSVLRWGCSTWSLNLKFAGDEDVFAAKFGMGREQAGAYAIHGGGVPIRVRGVEGVVAVVVVSGLKQHEDHGVIVDVVKENWEPVE
ncbi:heme-binding protein [Candidatus Bathyarchaeota archaeon]|nr:heme-binding protein [Candidatus Bathyarchaeota archaeon]